MPPPALKDVTSERPVKGRPSDSGVLDPWGSTPAPPTPMRALRRGGRKGLALPLSLRPWGRRGNVVGTGERCPHGSPRRARAAGASDAGPGERVKRAPSDSDPHAGSRAPVWSRPRAGPPTIGVGRSGGWGRGTKGRGTPGRDWCLRLPSPPRRPGARPLTNLQSGKRQPGGAKTRATTLRFLPKQDPEKRKG